MKSSLRESDNNNEQLVETPKQEFDIVYNKRKQYLEYLKRVNDYFKVLIDRLFVIVSGKQTNLDNRPVTEYQKNVANATQSLIRSFADIYNIEKDKYLQDVYHSFMNTMVEILKTLVVFIYTDKFRDSLNTRQHIQDYWDNLKTELVKLIEEINEHYKTAIVETLHPVIEVVKKPELEQLSFFSNFVETKRSEIITATPDKSGNVEDLNSLETDKPEVIPTELISVNNTIVNKPSSVKNYILTGTEVKGGIKTKCRNNILAIKTLKLIESEGRNATPEEMPILAAYAGWGGIPQVFGTAGEEWDIDRQELKDILTAEEYARAKASTLNAFYTPPHIISAIYDVIDGFGFKGGKIIDPSLGTGNFIGVYPEKWLSNSKKITGIELDSITGRIARQLYPNSDIRVQGFEDALIPNDGYDLAISNIPFGDYKVYDPKYNSLKLNIHDYFFAKAIDIVRPGGIIAFITSKGTMDKLDSSFRNYISERANLVGAIRLPNVAFKKYANTEVTADIIFLIKKDSNPVSFNNNWIDVVTNEDGIELNEYYNNNNCMLMGKMAIWKRMYGTDNTTLELPDDSKLEDILKVAVNNLPKGIYKEAVPNNDGTEEDDSIPADPTVKNYAYAMLGDTIYQREGSVMKPVKVSGKKYDRLKGMIDVRNTVRKLIDVQMQDVPDSIVQDVQEELNRVYDNFITSNSYINSKVNKDLFIEDPELPLIMALEIKNNEDGTFNKAEIFTKRTIFPKMKVTHVETAREALVITLNESANVDITRITELTGKTEYEVINELKGQIYFEPKLKQWVTAESYLSGFIREKLQIAKDAMEASGGKLYAENVQALEAVLPAPLKAEEIEVKIGATWVPEDIIQEFVCHLLDLKKVDVDVKYCSTIATFTLKSNDYRYSVKNSKTWGTERMSAIKILESSLNLRQVTVYDTHSDGTTELNKEETIAARAKQDSVKDAFKQWIFDDPSRRKRLVNIYNERFNNIRLRSYNGDYLALPGITDKVVLMKHQREAVARVINGGNTLLAHCVGSGKTFEMVAAAMELKRLGICQKSMFVVPNHLIEQWGTEFVRLYPNAKVLMCTKNDFEKQNRRRLISRIITGDWDAVIIAHSMFSKIPVSTSLLKEFIQCQIDDLQAAIDELDPDSDRATNRLVKQLEKQKLKRACLKCTMIHPRTTL